MNKDTHLKMGTAPVRKLLISMSLPTTFSMLIIALYNIVDGIFVSKLSEDALTAVSIAFPLQMLFIAVAGGTGMGGGSLISRLLGRGDTDKVVSTSTHVVVLTFLGWLAFALFGIFGTGFYLSAQQISGTVAVYAHDYIQIVTIMSFGLMIGMAHEKLLQASGDTVSTMYIQLLGAIINIILDPIFIFGYFGVPAMGVTGAAIATVTGQILSMLLAIYFVRTKPILSKPKYRNFKFSKEIIFEIYRIGIPFMVMQSVNAIVTMVLNGILAGISETGVAVLGAYYKLQSFVFMPIFGLNQGFMPIAGYNYGARNKERLISVMKNAIFIAVGIMAIGTAIFQLFPRELLSLFNASEEMYEIGIPALRILSAAFTFAAISIILSSVFQSLGKGIFSLLASLLRQVITLLPFAYFGSKVWGMSAVWLAFPFSEVTCLIVITIMVIYVYNKDIKNLVPNLND